MNNCGKKLKKKIRNRRFLRNKRSFIFIAVLFMGIGFAYLSSNLTITGNTSVSGNSWNIYFTNVQVTDGSVDATVAPITSGTNTTSIDYTVTLDKPGDFYEFTVDAVNNGTIDAMIESINMTSLDSDVAKYISYNATYEDGTPLAQNDVLKKNKTATYKVRVEFKKNISASDLSEEDISLTLTFGVNYVPSTIKPVVSHFAKMAKKNAILDNGINFINTPNGTGGLYVRRGTTEDEYPIYYYRGAITSNNALFAGFCWKIVRTTETGGTKLIYNGLPDENGKCSNTGTNSQLAQESVFNSRRNSPAYYGYMYGKVYVTNTAQTDSSYLYGNSFVYQDGSYTLKDTQSGVDPTHHYTCLNDSGQCSQVYYVYFVSGDTVYNIILSDGNSGKDAWNQMQNNTNDSVVKTAVDNWFKNIFSTYFTNLNKNYNDYLEDTVWCNDRSINMLGNESNKVGSGWDPDSGTISNYLWFSAYGRITTGTPRLDCPNKNDAFTVNDIKNGNGSLTYPVGLLTADEVSLAGGGGKTWSSDKNYYLYSGKYWWIMSPYYYGDGTFYDINIVSDGYCSRPYISSEYGVRPSISIKPNVKMNSGDGSEASPYEFVVE